MAALGGVCVRVIGAFFGILVISLFVFTACGTGRCVDDNFCAPDEQVLGRCGDCMPDFVPVETSMMYNTGQISDILREGETKTYTVGGIDYEITLTFISDPDVGVPQAKFLLNGELSRALSAGQTQEYSGGGLLTVTDILVNPREGVAMFTFSNSGVGTLYYEYCIGNLGGPYEGMVQVTTQLNGDIGTPEDIETVDQYMNFERVYAFGNFRVTQSQRGLDVDTYMHMPGQEENLQCFSRSRTVDPSRMYFAAVTLNPNTAVSERNYDNNFLVTQLEGAPVHFPKYLVEYDVGSIRYEGSAGGEERYLLPSGGKVYIGRYTDTTTNNNFPVNVYVPNNVQETPSVFDGFEGATTQLMSGLVRYTVSPPEDFNGRMLSTVQVAYLTSSNVLLIANFLWPADQTFSPDAHPLLHEYFLKLNARDECLVVDMLHLGETKTYTLKGIDHDINFWNVNTTNGQTGAAFLVNGYPTPTLLKGMSAIMQSGITLRLDELLYNTRDAQASICLYMAPTSNVYVGTLVEQGVKYPFVVDLNELVLLFDNYKGSSYAITLSGDTVYDGDWIVQGQERDVRVDLVDRTVDFRYPDGTTITTIISVA